MTGLIFFQAFLAIFFILTGVMKLIQTKEQLVKTIGWPEDYDYPIIRTLGVLEILGGLGVILPTVTGIGLFLVPVASTCLALVLSGATVEHIRREDMKKVGISTFVFFVSAIVGFGALLELSI
ncbi:MAG: DoxX family protein [Aureispira sp.]|nr:DoxX family protein [Aureispira sp.]